MKKESHIFIFSIVIVLTSIRLFSFVLIPDRITDYVEIILLLVILTLFIISTFKEPSRKNIFGTCITSIIVLTLLSSISSKIFHQQSYYLSFLISRTVIYWLLYFILFKSKPNKFNLEKLIVFVGTVWSVIMVIQQITFPAVLFNLPTVFFDYYSDTEIDFVRNLADERAGVVRIMILGIPYAYFLIFYSWIKLNENFKLKQFFILILTAVALSLTGSRQIIFTVILILAIDFFVSSKILIAKKISVLLFLSAAIYLGYPYLDEYFTSLIEVTKEQNIMSNEYVRIQEINYFLFDFFPSPFCYFFGNGQEHSLSSYGQEMMNKFLYRSDVGLFGAFNKFGIIYIIFIFMIYYKILIPKYRIAIPHHIRLLFIFLFLTSFTGTNYFEEPEFIPFLVINFYMIDRYNEKSYNINSNPQPIRNN